MEREIQGHIANGRVIKDSKRIFSRFLFNSSGGGGGGGSGSSRDFDTFLLLCVTIKFGILLPVAKSRRSACVCVRAFVASSRRLAGEKRREEPCTSKDGRHQQQQNRHCQRRPPPASCRPSAERASLREGSEGQPLYRGLCRGTEVIIAVFP